MRKPSQTAVAVRRAERPALIESMEVRRLAAADHLVGINVNRADPASVAVSVPILKKLGVNSVRLWCGLDDPNSRTLDNGVERAIDYKNAGFDVTLTVHPEHGTMHDAAAVKKWFEWMVSDPRVARSVDRWEIGNEVDSKYYWDGSLKQYVDNLLKPASEALHAKGESVVSAGVSWNPDDVQTLINCGMLNLVDAIGFHPYANGLDAQKYYIDKLNAIVAGRKPLVATEWNVRGMEYNKSAWASSIGQSYKTVHANFALDYYFCLYTQNTPAGPAGLLLNRTGAQNTAFYNAFASAVKNGQSPAPATTPTPTLGTAPTPTDGNTPAGADATISLYDADTQRVISGYADIKNNQVVDLAALPAGHKIAIVVVPTSKSATSVKMTLDGTTLVQSTKPYSFFGDDGWTSLKGGLLTPGTHTFKETPYSKDDAQGLAFAARTVTLTIKARADATPTPTITPHAGTAADADTTPEFKGVSLVNALTGAVIGGYSNLTANTTVTLSSLPTRSLALIAETDEDTRSVVMTTPRGTQTQSTLPYAFFGDTDGKYKVWTPGVGTYAFKAVAFGGASATGTVGQAMALTIRFV